MAVEISGNGLYIKSGVDNSELKKNLKELEAEVSKSMGKVGAIGENLDKLNTSMDKAITDAKTKYKSATKEMGDSSKAFGSEAGKAIDTTMSGFQAFDSLLKGLGFIGIISFAIDLFKELWQEHRNLKDTFNALKQNVIITAEALRDGGYIEAKAKVAALKEELKLATEGKISAKKAIDDYNNSLGKATGGVASLGEMEKKLTQQAEGYLQMLALKTKATIAYRKAAEEGVLADIEMSNYGNWKEGFMRFVKSPGKWFQPMAPGVNPFQSQIDFAQTKKDAESFLNKIGDGYQKEAAEIAQKFKLNFFNDTKIKDPKDQRQDIYNDTKALKDLLDEISGSGKKYEIQFATNADSEREKINKYFDDLRKKVADFNNDPKRRFKIDASTAFGEIETNRKNSLELADYSLETKDLLDELAIRKKAYEDYEKLKYRVGSEAADKQYKGLIGKHKTYLESLESEEKALYEKGGLTVAENDRYIRIQQLVMKARSDQKSEQSKWVGEMLTNYSTYEQRKAGIVQQGEDDVKKAIDTGHADLVNGIKERTEKALIELDNSRTQERAKLGGFFDDMILTSQNAVKAQIENINYLLNNATLTPEQRAALLKSLKETEGLLGKNSRQMEREQLLNQLSGIDAEIKRIKEDTPKAKDEVDKLMRDRAGVTQKLKDLDDFAEKISNLRAVAGAVGELGGMLSSLSETNPQLAALGNTLQDVASSADLFISNWEKLANDTLKSSDKIQMAATFIINALNNIIQSTQQNRAKEAESLQNVIDFQRGYNLALIEEAKIKESMSNSVFFKDNMATVKANLSAQIKLVNEYDKALKNLNDGQIKVGTTKAKRDWARVGASTLAGAGTGAVIGASGGVLSAVGAVVGGIVGFIGGMLEKRKVIDVYDNLLKRYPDLISAEGKLNDALAKSLLSSNLLDAKTKDTLQYVTNLAEEYKKAQAEIDAVIKDVIGDVGGNIMDALITDFKGGGTDAGKAFREGFAKSLENMYKDVIYASIFGAGLNKLQKDIEDGFKSGDMNAMESSLYEFLDTQEKNATAAQELMKKMQDYAKTKGIDIFSVDPSGKDKNKGKNSLTGAFSQASQQSIDLLSGHTMGMKIAQLQSNVHLKNIEIAAFKNLDAAVQTAYNTGQTVIRLDTAVKSLQGIESKMNNNANNALAAGI